MPIEVISAQTAIRSRHKASRYPDPKRDPERYVPYPTVSHEAAFQIGPEDKIFTIGSCFARNTERALDGMGMSVLSAMLDGTAPNENITNKYTTKSIVHDLRVAFGAGYEPDSTVYGDDTKGYYNLTFGGMGAVKASNKSDINNLTRQYFDNLKKLREADVVIITLGLVEVWYDKERSVFLNIIPNPAWLKANANSLELHVMGVEDIVGDLQETFSTLRKVARSGVRFLLTVSPVPLHATFRQQDCLQANMYSKAVQRTAAEIVCNTEHDVTYFPSFEMVMLASPEIAWGQDDFRHVRPDLVNRIMRGVISAYVGDKNLVPSKELLKSLLDEKRFQDIVGKIEEYMLNTGRPLEKLPIYAKYYLAWAFAKTERKKDAIDLLRSVCASAPQHVPAQNLLTRLSN